MFYKISKIFAAFSIASVSIIMSAIITFNQLLPEKLYINNGDKTEIISLISGLITFSDETEKTKTVFKPEETFHFSFAKLLGIFPVKEVSLSFTDEKIVTVCGTPFGIKMFTDGVLVVGFSKIETEDGNFCPAADAGLLGGDVILAINGKKVCTNEEVAECIENSEGKALDFLINRGEDVTISITPKMLKDKSAYKAGFWVRDSSAGIGTLTFFDSQTMNFAGLGHAVCDVDTGTVLPLLSGEIVPAAITSIEKGVAGNPGELSGTFTDMKTLGTVTVNNETGIFGKLEYEIDGLSSPIGHKQDIYEGSAVILSTVDGTKVNEYDIVIEKISLSDNSPTKNMIIRVIDEELISQTGGIVQGMSGSPILQDGKLIGAVTHVFVNEPTKGYGIFIENMLDVTR